MLRKSESGVLKACLFTRPARLLRLIFGSAPCREVPKGGDAYEVNNIERCAESLEEAYIEEKKSMEVNHRG